MMFKHEVKTACNVVIKKKEKYCITHRYEIFLQLYKEIAEEHNFPLLWKHTSEKLKRVAICLFL